MCPELVCQRDIFVFNLPRLRAQTWPRTIFRLQVYTEWPQTVRNWQWCHESISMIVHHTGLRICMTIAKSIYELGDAGKPISGNTWSLNIRQCCRHDRNHRYCDIFWTYYPLIICLLIPARARLTYTFQHCTNKATAQSYQTHTHTYKH